MTEEQDDALAMLEEPQSETISDDPFYVGDKPTPRPVRRFYTIAVLLMFALSAAGGAALAAFQRDPGDGVGRYDRTAAFTGTLVAAPYPMLRTADADGRPLSVLLVADIKRDVADRVEPFLEREVEVVGNISVRAGLHLMSLSTGDAAITPLSAAPAGGASTIPEQNVGRYTLKGEIVDSKCYLGAMKPADRVTHKGCACICLIGDVPPLFVIRDQNGETTAYLLTDPEGRPVNDRLIEYVNEPVELTGVVTRREDLLVFMVDPESLRLL